MGRWLPLAPVQEPGSALPPASAAGWWLLLAPVQESGPALHPALAQAAGRRMDALRQPWLPVKAPLVAGWPVVRSPCSALQRGLALQEKW